MIFTYNKNPKLLCSVQLLCEMLKIQQCLEIQVTRFQSKFDRNFTEMLRETLLEDSQKYHYSYYNILYLLVGKSSQNGFVLTKVIKEFCTKFDVYFLETLL